MLDEASLRGVTRPVAIRWGDADDIAPPDANARLYAAGIPGADARSVGRNVRHEVFFNDLDEGRSEARERAAPTQSPSSPSSSTESEHQ